MLAIFLGVCAYGAFQVKDGLDVAEMIPRHKVEYAFVSARFQYFSFYRMHAVTKDSFDYANKQRLLHKYHQSFAKVRVVMTGIAKLCVNFLGESFSLVLSIFNVLPAINKWKQFHTCICC